MVVYEVPRHQTFGAYVIRVWMVGELELSVRRKLPQTLPQSHQTPDQQQRRLGKTDFQGSQASRRTSTNHC